MPFSTGANGLIGRWPESITRIDRRRSINVQAGVDPTLTTSAQVIDALEEQFLQNLMARHPGIPYSFEGDQADLAGSVGGLLKGFVVIVFVMYALLAIPLNSYWKPTNILSADPFEMVGAIWGHAILGLELSFVSVCGLVALAGVVVTAALVMVAFINQSVRRQASIDATALYDG